MRESKPYHHGHLREALLQAAIHLIAEMGPKGFTLREVARRANVSHNAPYRHFRDKDDLLAAVAAQGFRELTQAMLEEAASKSNARDRLKHSGLAYVSFALRRPEHFTVMFDLPASKSQRPEYTEAAKGAFAALRGFVEDCQVEGQLPSGRSRDRALLAWSLVHGIAKLAVAGQLASKSQSDIIEFAAFAIDESFAAHTPATPRRKGIPASKPSTRS
jgi:AcrR family transcriptional regulator